MTAPRPTQPPDLIETAEAVLSGRVNLETSRMSLVFTPHLDSLQAAVNWYREQEAEASSWPGQTDLLPMANRAARMGEGI